MECNRDEAIRAKGLAEKKMQNNDFEGARKIALKARQLFPEVENISQLLAVCDVHCSAESKIYGSEKDLYGILQVERLANEATIRKQYRKLALILHPDKNKFPGAEAAFKLIGEANMVLSDNGKRYLHDLKCKGITAQKQTHHQGHQSSFNRPQYDAQNKVPNASNFQFSGSTHHLPTQSGPENGRESFWTVCPFCNIRYQYYREFVKRALRCQSCTKPFIAYDMGSYMGRTGVQSKNPASNLGQPAVSQQKEAPKQGSFKAGKQSTERFSSFHSETQTNSTIGVETDPLKRTESTAPGLDLKTKVKENRQINMEDGKERVAMPKADAANPREAGTSRNTNRKRMRNMVVESSESGDTGSDSDMEEVVFEGSAGQDSGVENGQCTRRSSRQRQQVSYNENANDNDDILRPPKRSRETKPSGDGEEEQKEEIPSHEQSKSGHSADVPVASAVDKKIFKRKGTAHAEGSTLHGIGKDGKHKVEEAETVTGNDQSEANSDSDCASDPEVFECLDPEFSDFDKNKEEHCFAVGQIWACYDTVDGMPRFYAQVRKVYSPGFKLRITWLEADPDDKGEIGWAEEGLPVACGKFKRGDSEDTSDRLTFSHQPFYEKGSGRSFVIYPSKGETWALFKDWDIKWSSDPENHRKYKYEVVEVLSDFVKDIGVRVAYLEKVKGFVSLFQKTSQTGISDSLIPASELFRFSHRVPSFKMTGTERQGVPRESFELDPAALPTNPDDLYCSDEVKMENESMDAKVNGSCPEFSEEKLKSKMGDEKMSTPKKCVNSEGKNDLIQETFILRRSPRELNKVDKNDNHVHESSCSTQEGALKHLNGIKDTSTCVTPSKGTTCQVNEEIRKPMDTSPNSFSKIPSIHSSLSSSGKKSEEVFHDFCAEKSEGRFEVGQIWALYKGEGEMPRNYGQIKKIESSPFRLYAASLEVCAPPTYSCCGIFKVCLGKSKLYQPSSFSHLVKAECNGKNRFNIYPRVQEIWAIYKKWNADSTFSDLEKGGYNFVEVLESSVEYIKATFLLHLNGTKSVFRAPRRQRSTIGIIKIPKAELARFSHQIPAFQLTGEKDGRLRDCWELDPASLPGLASHEVKKS